MKMMLATAALVLLPSFAAFAECGTHSAQTISCADGQVWDSESRTCTPRTTS